jgi:hypothetical protein
LKEYNINNGSTLQLMILTEDLNYIFVKIPGNKTIIIKADEDDSILLIK